ncbi:zinc finger protein [Trypanosoma grayi]|uniref:zinc finger protein n=1 Tax=Trypanosoma grayi TaxID=71804 RepID=UPI0004F49F76|nr:zinc finger protein [Trypanosoma grayi]KEG08824.1 zinc finger protein [Trypanosoma grayi]
MATALLLWAFYRVVTTAAGYVSSEPWKYPPTYVGKSPDYRPPNSADPVVNPYTVTQLDRNNRLRFCEQCGQFKPDRAHHCTMCGRCTYRFDHHCPVVNNCIGRENYKMFVLFLMYAALAGFLDGGLMLLGFFVIEDGDWSVLWLMVAVLMMLLSSSVFLFGLTHVWWLSRGESTMSIRVASYDKSKRLPSAERRAERDIERRKHWDAVLGSDRRWWRVILPLRPTRTSEEVPI